MIQDGSVIEVVYSDTPSDFDKILPLQPSSLNIVPKRFMLMTGQNSWKTIELLNDNEYAQHIYKTIIAGLASDWFVNLGDVSKLGVHVVLTDFVDWLNAFDIAMDNRYMLLKLFESKRTNEDNVKPQSSGLKRIIPTLSAGIYSPSLDKKAAAYIDELLKNTKLSLPDERNPITLAAFFASMPWLRDIMGEKDYLKLESPKGLIDSFSITIATTLLFIIDAKKQAQLFLKNPSELEISNAKTQPNIAYNYSRFLLETFGCLDKEGQPANNLTWLILADCVPIDRQDTVLNIWISLAPGSKFPLFTIVKDSRRFHFTESHLLAVNHWGKPSTIEQILFCWLCAVQMIQPTDVGKLKRNDFAIHRNQLGRPLAIQCSYYKGRSGREHEPPVLDASSIEGRAILAYLDYPESTSLSLCEGGMKKIAPGNHPTSIPGRLLRLWSDKMLVSLVHENMLKRKCSPLFLRAYKSMLLASSESYSAWRGKNIGDFEKYKQTVKRPLPNCLFGLGAIKTSAVHARSDKYRAGDLVNQNSHSNQTEILHYLTDANKDWVNQNGRITRAVLLDIERYVYRPNLDAAIQQAHENLLRTHVISALDAGINNGNEVQINSLGQFDFGKDKIEEIGFDADSIVVLDTPETIINMLHYMNEAERQKDTLVANALPFFERTILPTVEWMHVVISRMSPSVIQDGDQLYTEIRELLPPLFSNELRTGITA